MRKKQYEILVEYLREQGGEATLRQIHLDCYIQNVYEACRQARKHGYTIETIKDKDNPKIASYKLVEEVRQETNLVEAGRHTVPETRTYTDGRLTEIELGAPVERPQQIPLSMPETREQFISREDNRVQNEKARAERNRNLGLPMDFPQEPTGREYE